MTNTAVVYAVDSRSILPLAVSLRALRRHSMLLPEVHVVESGLRYDEKARVERASGIVPKWITIDPMKSLPGGLRPSEANYYRLWLPETLPGLDHVLYLDPDTLPLADVSQLLGLAREQTPLQACLDYRGEISNPLVQLPNFAQLGLSPHDPFFSTGVLLMNLKMWREEGIAAKAAKLGHDHPEATHLADQTTINAVLKVRILELPPEWNVQTVPPALIAGEWSEPYLPQTLAGAKILHYAGEFRPYSPQGKDLPGAMAWLKERSQLTWE